MDGNYKVYGNAEPYKKEGKLARAKNWVSEHKAALGVGLGASITSGVVGHALGKIAEAAPIDVPFEVPEEPPSE